MKVVAWIVEGTWRSCVDAARDHSPADAETTLLLVLDDEVPSVAHGAFAGLFGRGHADRDPGPELAALSATAADDLLRRASERLGRASTSEVRRGRVEREVVAATADADLLVVARDGDRHRLGPKSLGHASRFVVDHAACPVLLVWPADAPGLGTIPPPPHASPPPHPGPPPPHGGP